MTGTPEDSASDDALAQLYAAERPSMVQLATLLVRSPAVAEEVVQDAFIAVRDRWPGLDRPGAYLRTTVVNGCSQVLRRREIEQRHAALQPPVSEAELPSRLVELSDALDQLSDRQRIVIVLRYLLELPDDEIAATLGARPASVRSLAHRGLAVLRKELS